MKAKDIQILKKFGDSHYILVSQYVKKELSLEEGSRIEVTFETTKEA